VVQRLKERAKANDRSLEAEVRHILRRVVQDRNGPVKAEFWERAEELRRETAGSRQTPSEILIREDRDHGHPF
jgi:plasmid stability protein